jgi:hypothetical protein
MRRLILTLAVLTGLAGAVAIVHTLIVPAFADGTSNGCGSGGGN